MKKNIAREVKRRVAAQNSNAVMDALVKSHDFPLPQSLVSDEAARLMEEMKQNLSQQGFDAGSLNLDAEMFKERAANRVALGLLLPVIVSENKLGATDEQVKAIVSETAESYEDPQEVIDWYFADRQRLQDAQNLAVENNLVEFVLGKAKVSERKLSFDEIMGGEAAAA